MAVIKAKPKKLVDWFIPLLQRELISPFLAYRVSGDQFKGAKGDTVVLKVKGLKAKTREYDFRGRTAPIVLDDILGGYELPFKLNKHVYSATGLEDEHFTLDDVAFMEEVVRPQVSSIAADFETRTVTAFRALSFKHTLTALLSDDPHLVALEAKRLMDSEKVAPRTGRYFLVGSDVAANWLASDRLSKYDSTGQVGTPALRDATIGKLANSPVVEHSELDPAEAYYVHNTGLAVASVAPSMPRGVSAGAYASANGLSVRVIQDYDANYLRDRCISSMFLGVNEIRDERGGANKDEWIFEEGEVDTDDYAAYGITDPATQIVAAGTRKNVRAVKLTLTGTGSVLDNPA